MVTSTFKSTNSYEFPGQFGKFNRTGHICIMPAQWEWLKQSFIFLTTTRCNNSYYICVKFGRFRSHGCQWLPRYPPLTVCIPTIEQIQPTCRTSQQHLQRKMTFLCCGIILRYCSPHCCITHSRYLTSHTAISFTKGHVMLTEKLSHGMGLMQRRIFCGGGVGSDQYNHSFMTSFINIL